MSQKVFDVVSSGVIYRCESGLQGYYPRVVKTSEDEFVCSFVASEALETLDMHPMIAMTTGIGQNWTLEGSVDFANGYSETGFISRGSHGLLFCLGGRWPIVSDSPDTPIIDSETCGMRRNEMVLRRSSDNGNSWSEPEIIAHGVDAPLEIPTGVVTLSNGDLLVSFSTWKDWDGSCPYGHRIMVIRSSDNGKSWSEPVTIFYDPTDNTGYWEGRISEMPDGKLIATCWAHDWTTDQDINNQYSISEDGGVLWSVPTSMPVAGQTGWPIAIGDDLILFVYNHRKSPVGVRGMISRLNDSGCEMIFDAPVFEPQVKTESTISSDNYAVTDFQFGAPSAISLGMGRYMVVYWCVVQGRAGINWTEIQVK